MKIAAKLINFNVPENIKVRFDEYCQILGTTRSKVLNEMVEDFLIQNEELVAERIAKRDQLNELDKNTSRILRFREFLEQNASSQDDEGPPRFFMSEHI